MSNQEEKNPELDLAFRYLQDTSENVFLTGKAGTGKTTFLHNLRKSSPKRMVVLAPTGVAAINAGGMTIHSFFQMPFGPWIPGGRADVAADGDFRKGLSAKFHKFSREKLNIIKSLDLIIIDEISMVRSDLLDGIDEILRKFRNRDRPFGGIQLLMIGDLQQLAPVVKEDEWEILKEHYDTPFFFGSNALRKSSYVTIELKRVYRQSDSDFIEMLNRVRDGDRSPETIALINKRYTPDIKGVMEGCITLTTHNYQAKQINEERMRRLEGRPWIFKAKIEGDFPEYSYPTDSQLELRIGAQVMFVKNDTRPDKRYFNGKIGKVADIDEDKVYVKCSDDEPVIEVEMDCWENMKYGLDKESGEIVETVTGKFTQYPLKAAWAITIHKSQGLTFDKVVIDAGAAFAHGQVYVALSRCRTLEGLFLTSRLTPRVLINSSSVSEFIKSTEKYHPDENHLLKAMISFQQSLLRELFDLNTVDREIRALMRLAKENKECLCPGLMDSLTDLNAKVKNEITDVADRFSLQIQGLLRKEPVVERNEELLERIRKGCVYFREKLESHVGGILCEGGKIDVDKKEIRKSIAASITRLREEMEKKSHCFQVCGSGFSVKTYLEARAKAAIEKPSVKESVTKPETFDFSDVDQELYMVLKSWRRQKAGSLDKPEFMILSNKTIAGISTLLPSSMKELKGVTGIGRRKLKEYGEEILGVIAEYCKKNGIEYCLKDEPVKDSPKRERVNTRQVSLDLLNSGKTLQEVASIRGLSLSTIEGHIADLISTGDLDISRILSEEKISEISEFFLSHNSRELSPAKENFGDKYSYGELRMVLAHLDSIGQENAVL